MAKQSMTQPSAASGAPESLRVTGTVGDLTVATPTLAWDPATFALQTDARGSVITWDAVAGGFVVTEPGVYMVSVNVAPGFDTLDGSSSAIRGVNVYSNGVPEGTGFSVVHPLVDVSGNASSTGVSEPIIMDSPGLLWVPTVTHAYGLVGTDAVYVFMNIRVWRVATLPNP